MKLNRINLESPYSVKPRSKHLVVKMSDVELHHIAKVARESGNTISSFTRKALSSLIRSTLEEGR